MNILLTQNIRKENGPWGKRGGGGGWVNKLDRWLWKLSRNCPLLLFCMKILCF